MALPDPTLREDNVKGLDMKILALIPARMGSSRFPGKPMAPLCGIPMIEHVYRRVALNDQLAATAVATCDEVIANHIAAIGGRVVMTGHHHERASDRCAEALVKLEDEVRRQFDIVVMVQGDEPLVHPDMISEALAPLRSDPEVRITNLLGKISGPEEFEDRNCIKVVCDQRGNALYFSREPIPTRAKGTNAPMGKQICVIPFRRDFLLQYTRMPPTPLEVAESVDMLRVLENGFEVRMVPTDHGSQSVDTEADRVRVERLLATDELYQRLFAGDYR
jgi:3-deoxy-manno-octulosonate cytidylyltransferase (CMP-KDO synthetase)